MHFRWGTPKVHTPPDSNQIQQHLSFPYCSLNFIRYFPYFIPCCPTSSWVNRSSFNRVTGSIGIKLYKTNPEAHCNKRLGKARLTGSVAACAPLVEFAAWRKWCGTAKHLECSMWEGGEGGSKGWRDGDNEGVENCWYGRRTHVGVLYIWKLKTPFVAKRRIILCQKDGLHYFLLFSSSGQTANQSAVRNHWNSLLQFITHQLPTQTAIVCTLIPLSSSSLGGWGAEGRCASWWQWPRGSSEQLEPGGESRGMPLSFFVTCSSQHASVNLQRQ